MEILFFVRIKLWLEILIYLTFKEVNEKNIHHSMNVKTDFDVLLIAILDKHL